MRDLKSFIDILDSCAENSSISNHKGSGIVIGDSGLALCWAYLYHQTKDESHYSKLDDILTAIMYRPGTDLTMGKGLTGIAWTVSLINQLEILEDGKDWLCNIDSILEQEYRTMLLDDNTDYFSGATGLLFYFLDRNEKYSKLSDISNLFISHIEAKVENDDWGKPYPDLNNKSYNNINLGVPHGITGLLLALLLIKEKNILEIDQLIIRLTDKLLSYRVKTDECIYYFPSQIWEDKRPSPSIISWCYGDLMAAYALLKAGFLLRQRRYYALSLKILQDTLKCEKTHPDALVLCHGYTSLVHIYDQVFRITGNNVFHEKAEYWESKSIQNFEKCWSDYRITNNYSGFFENPSLFLGVPGFFLSLLAWNNSIYDRWVKCLLL
ncbi:MAG: lanthionine synthetase LanC family protein [Mangrovibacterium sp.]